MDNYTLCVLDLSIECWWQCGSFYEWQESVSTCIQTQRELVGNSIQCTIVCIKGEFLQHFLTRTLWILPWCTESLLNCSRSLMWAFNSLYNRETLLLNIIANTIRENIVNVGIRKVKERRPLNSIQSFNQDDWRQEGWRGVLISIKHRPSAWRQTSTLTFISLAK